MNLEKILHLRVVSGDTQAESTNENRAACSVEMFGVAER